MVYNLSDFRGFGIHSLEGPIGKAHDFYFSKSDWKVYYLLCDTGYWMTDRLVIFSIEAIKKIDTKTESIFLNLSKEKIFNSPFISSESLVSRINENKLFDYYGWFKYWETEEYKQKNSQYIKSELKNKHVEVNSIAGLNCTREIIGQIIQADQTQVGRLSSLIANTDGWQIVFMLINYDNADPSKKLIINPYWISKFEYNEKITRLNVPIDRVLNSPKIFGAKDFTEDYVRELKKLLAD